MALVPLIVFWAIGHEEYLLSALIGLFFAALDDPGGSFGRRASYVSVFGLIGAGLTAPGSHLGGQAWGWLALAAFVVTLPAGLAVAFGARRFVTALLLNVWFIVAFSISFVFRQHARGTSCIWAQTVSWVGGVALWIAVAFVAWLIQGRRDQPPPVPEIPGDTSRRKLTPPLIVFAVLRAVVIGGTVALAFGLDLSHNYWMPIAAMVAMKPNLEQATLAAAQRLAGALIGALRSGVSVPGRRPGERPGWMPCAPGRGVPRPGWP
ncbi:FUSC family protein [Streptomyces sp. NPDC021012]|uniref:FUSC family protein n=1 Tax=Streptomyces sp. NPDC021012 TaxID=3365107 RepID=UPI0037BCF73A